MQKNMKMLNQRKIDTFMISLFPNVGCMGPKPKIIFPGKKMLTTVDRSKFPNLMGISRTGLLEDWKPYA